MTWLRLVQIIGETNDDPTLSKLFSRTDQGDIISNGLHCQHMFHNDCLTLWLRKQPSCPCCRLAISEPPPGFTKEEMQEEDLYDPYGTERICLYVKWLMTLCGFLAWLYKLLFIMCTHIYIYIWLYTVQTNADVSSILSWHHRICIHIAIQHDMIAHVATIPQTTRSNTSKLTHLGGQGSTPYKYYCT
jgi:hypothetical protein